MLADHISVSTSQWSDERSMTMHLILTTLAGEETQLTIELQELTGYMNLKMQCWSNFPK